MNYLTYLLNTVRHYLLSRLIDKNSKIEFAKGISLNFVLVFGIFITSGSLFGQNVRNVDSRGSLNAASSGNASAHLWMNEPFSDYPQDAEIIEKRNAKSKHFINSSGAVTAHLSTGDIHYWENGQWKTIFHTISPSSSGFENTTNSIKTYYPSNSSGSISTVLPDGKSVKDMMGMRMYYEVNGLEELSQNIQSKQGLVDFNILTYPNIYGNGIDLRLTQNTSKRKMDYIIQSQAALNSIPSGAQYLVFEEKLELPNGWTVELVDNEIIVKNGQGIYVAKYDKPVYKDTPPPHVHSNNEGEVVDNHVKSEVVGDYVISQSGNQVTVKTKVPVEWLISSERIFPVVIDPTVDYTPLNTANWTGRIGHNGYGGTTVGGTTNDLMKLGVDGDVCSSWAKFDITSLTDGACITTASLHYYVSYNYTNGADCRVWTRMRHMANDPVGGTSASRLADIRDGSIYSNYDFATHGSTGWHSKDLYAFTDDISTSTFVDWFAVGLENHAGGPHPTCYNEISGRSSANRPYLRVTYLNGSTVSTSATGGGTFCWGNNITLNSTGGTNGTGVTHVWYKGGCNNAFTQVWGNQPYASASTTQNSNNNGILSLTSTSNDPMINMFGLGSFNPATYRYMNIRYRVTAGTAGNVEVFFLNTTYPAPNGACHTSAPLISDGQWHVARIDLQANANYTTGGNIVGWRYDWCTANGVTMDLDFIQLSQYPMIDEDNTTRALEWTTAHPDYPTAGTTTYATAKLDACGTVTSCVSTTVTLPNKVNVLAQNSEAATCNVGAGETVHFYNTSSGRYIATVTANATALGNTTATTYTSADPNATPIVADDCNNPGLQLAVLGRHWIITPTVNTSATVRLPYYNQELNLLMPASGTSSSPFDLVTSQADLGLSKYSGPANVNDQWNDNCASATTTFQSPNGFGNLSAYAPGWPANTDRYSMFNITGFSEFWLHASSNFSPLPVELTSFTADCQEDGKVQLRWVTASENNSSHFIIEKSDDANNWKSLTTIPAAGNSVTTNYYDAMDEYSRGTNYYRLIQVDNNGTTEIYDALASNCDVDKVGINLFPNPSSSGVTLELNQEIEGENVYVGFYDIHGKMIKRVDINPDNDKYIYVDVKDLASGYYIVRLFDGQSEKQPIRFVKQ